MIAVLATEARSRLAQLIDKICKAHKPLRITNGKGKSCVMIPEDDWDSIQETLYLSSIPGMKESLLKAAAEPLSQCVDKLPWENGE